MNKPQALLPLATSILLLSSCQSFHERNVVQEISPTETSDPMESHPLEYRRNGKIKNADLLTDIYSLDQARSKEIQPQLNADLIAGLENQRRLLKKRKAKNRKAGNLTIEHQQLEKVVDLLQQAAGDPNFDLSSQLNAYQIQGNDEKGSVYYTGYFTPIIKVSEKPTDTYKYPLYTRPLDWVGSFPTREEIDGEKVLAGQGLELAYASNPVDVYFMQVQGSGIVEYTDGRRVLFANNGHNGHRYRSIGRYMIENGLTTPQYVSINSIRKILGEHPEWMDEVLYSNPSYVFFQPRKARPTGAGQVPLTSDYSIAVDPKYVPLGSCLLASVPMHDARGNFTHHEYRVLLAQDTGGAINGPGHVDVYTGIGRKAKKEAGYTHHYGNMWLLLPNDEILATLP